MGTPLLVKADLGTKRGCPSCNARFYDLEKRPIECPKCGFSYEPEALFKQRRRQPEPAGPVRAVESEDEEDEDEDENEDGETEAEEAEEEVVEEAPLNVAATGEDEEEEAEEEPETAEGMSVVEGDEGVEIEDIEVEDDEDEEDNDLLSEVEDEEDDVSGIIDPGIAKDEA